MYSVEDANGFSDAGDTWYEDLEDVTYGNNLEWEDAKEDYEGAVSNFECLFGDYNSVTSVEGLSDMLNNMYHTMSDHSSETDNYIGCVRDSIKRMCEGNDNIAHSYHHPSRRTTISFSGNVDAMYKAYMLERNS
jgi:predicted GIY-YIG superfamily endonuclease